MPHLFRLIIYRKESEIGQQRQSVQATRQSVPKSKKEPVDKMATHREDHSSGLEMTGLLPIELLISVFEYCVQTQPASILRLQLVSRQWRYLVNHSPSLWNCVQIIEPFHSTKLESYKCYIDTCMKRSYPLPLHVSFVLREYIGAQRHQAVALLSRLATHASDRWKSFLFVWMTPMAGVTPFDIHSNTLQLILSGAIKLQAVSLQTNSGSLFNEAILHTVSLNSSLRSLHLLPIRPWKLVTSFPEVQELTLDWEFRQAAQFPSSAGSDANWLPQFPSLRRLTLRGERPRFFPHPNTLSTRPYHTAIHVTHLVLIGCSRLWTIRCTTFPALQYLSIKGATNENMDTFFKSRKNLKDTDISRARYLTMSCTYQPRTPPSTTIEDEAMKATIAPMHSVVNLRGPGDKGSSALLAHLIGRLRDLEHLEACGCIWRQIWVNSDDEGVFLWELTRRGCSELSRISGLKLSGWTRWPRSTTNT